MSSPPPPDFIPKTDEHFDECTLCDTNDPERLKDAVAVILRPDDPPHLAAVYCKTCIRQLSLAARRTVRRDLPPGSRRRLLPRASRSRSES